MAVLKKTGSLHSCAHEGKCRIRITVLRNILNQTATKLITLLEKAFSVPQKYSSHSREKQNSNCFIISEKNLWKPPGKSNPGGYFLEPNLSLGSDMCFATLLNHLFHWRNSNAFRKQRLWAFQWYQGHYCNPRHSSTAKMKVGREKSEWVSGMELCRK